MKPLLLIALILTGHLAAAAPVEVHKVPAQHLTSDFNFGMSALEIKTTATTTDLYIDRATLYYPDGISYEDANAQMQVLRDAFQLNDIGRLVIEFPSSQCEAKATNINILKCGTQNKGNLVVRAISTRHGKNMVESPIHLQASTANIEIVKISSENFHSTHNSLQAHIHLRILDENGNVISLMYIQKSSLVPLRDGLTPHF